MTSIADTIWESTREEFGDDLRAVTYYYEDEFETRLRSDIRETYSCEEDKQIVEEIFLNGLHVPHLEDLFRAGEFQGNIYVFDEARVVHYPIDESRGLLVSVQRSDSLPTVSAIETSLDRVEASSPKARAGR